MVIWGILIKTIEYLFTKRYDYFTAEKENQKNIEGGWEDEERTGICHRKHAGNKCQRTGRSKERFENGCRKISASEQIQLWKTGRQRKTKEVLKT